MEATSLSYDDALQTEIERHVSIYYDDLKLLQRGNGFYLNVNSCLFLLDDSCRLPKLSVREDQDRAS
jgi:hypothetical protein